MISYESVTSVGEGEREEGERGGEKPTHLAFGTKVRIPEHILTSRKSARSTAMPTSRQTAVSAKAAAGGRKDNIEELEVQTKRVELLSGEKQTNTTRGQSNTIHQLSAQVDRAVIEKDGKERHNVLHTHHHDDTDHHYDTDHRDDMEEESVVEMLKEVEIERREELSERKEQHSNNETTYLYSSHPKSASNLMV